MAKPIFTVGIDICSFEENYERVEKMCTEKMPDYYVLVYSATTTDPIFNVYYEKDFNEVKYEELKQIVKDSMKLSNNL